VLLKLRIWIIHERMCKYQASGRKCFLDTPDQNIKNNAASTIFRDMCLIEKKHAYV